MRAKQGRRVSAITLAGIIGWSSFAFQGAVAEEPSGHNPEALRAELRGMIETARNKVFPALVNIQLVTSHYAGGKEIKGRSVGSGTIISPQGYVLTNQHVTDYGRRFRCTLADKQEISARLVGEDALTDLAVLQLNLDEYLPKGAALPVATLGDSAATEVGDFVMAMGSPLALSRSVTLGIISNTERVFAGGLMDEDPDDMQLGRGQRTGLFTRWIQHDALINPGNSGGPLINLQGEIIGINELGGSQIGFAIPSNLAREVYESIVAHGEVLRSWVGVSFKSIQKTGLDHGVLVDSVIKNSPASKAGLEPGDLLTSINGESITVRFPEEIPLLLKKIADFPIGSSLKIMYERAGKTSETTLVTQKLDRDRGREAQFKAWGFTALEITPMAARERRLASTAGVLVSGVRGGSRAANAKPALAADDVIRAIDGEPINTFEDLTKRYDQLTAAKPAAEGMLVEFERRGENYVTVLEPQKDDDDNSPPPQLAKAWIGVAVQPVLKNLAKKLALEQKAGFRITRVYPRTKAAGADLHVGDVIIKLNNERLEPKRPEDTGLFQREVQRLDIDSTAELTVLRDGKSLSVAVPVEATRVRPDEVKREHNQEFELTVREITFFDRVENHWDDSVEGALVVSAEGAGWAGLGGVQPGDLIQRIDQQPITDPASFRKVLADVIARKPERIVFVVLRGVRTRFLYIEPEWKIAPPATAATENSAPRTVDAK